MLLDFNLADDAAVRGKAEAARIGGTLPYMAPEQLSAFQGRVAVIDAELPVGASKQSWGARLMSAPRRTGPGLFPAIQLSAPYVCLSGPLAPFIIAPSQAAQ